MPRVTRMEIDLALAEQMIEAAKNMSRTIDVPVSIAVLDHGANLLAFSRMDGAELAGPNLAVDKAYTSVTNRTETGALKPRVAPDGDLPGMNANGNGRYIAFAGGIPCWDGDVVVGAIGVSGGSWEDDQVIAEAAIAVFNQAAK